MKVTAETITPTMAQRYLDKSDGNRAVRAGAVAGLSMAMAAGQFHDNGQTIRFSTTGRLMDGHHRLAACVHAGRSFKSLVVRGVAEAATHTIDIGITRTLGDHLKFRGDGYYNLGPATVSQVIRLLGGWKQKLNVESFDEWTSWLSPGYRTITETLDSCKYANKGYVVGAFVFASRADVERVAALAEEIKAGTVAHGAVGFLMRDMLVSNGRGNNRRFGPEDMARRLVSGIYAHLHGKRLQKILASSEALAFFASKYKGTNALASIKAMQGAKNEAAKISTAINTAGDVKKAEAA